MQAQYLRPTRIAFLFCFLLRASAFAQPADEAPTIGHSIKHLLGFFAPFFPPKLVQDDYLLKEYIRSEEFAHLRAYDGDLAAVDAIFGEARRLCWGNLYEALFISLLATMDHRRFGVKLPVVGPLLWVPLTGEFPDEFEARIAALPRRLYNDSPRAGAGDRDKLQHFFGSAFLTYAFESRAAAERVGQFIEWGEDKIIVDGALDERDMRANRQGQEFGLRLLDEASVRPSAFLRSVVVQADSPPFGPCGFFDRMEMR